MKSLAESIAVLASQLARVEKIPNSEELCHIIGELPGMMEEVMDFIQEWLENWTRTENSCEMNLSLIHCF